jgi:hypothetical protein
MCLAPGKRPEKSAPKGQESMAQDLYPFSGISPSSSWSSSSFRLIRGKPSLVFSILANLIDPLPRTKDDDEDEEEYDDDDEGGGAKQIPGFTLAWVSRNSGRMTLNTYVSTYEMMRTPLD